MQPVAQIHGINATVSRRVTNGYSPAAATAEQQPLQQSHAFACRAAEHGLFTIRAVLFQALLVLQELFQRDVSFVVLRQTDPRLHYLF